MNIGTAWHKLSMLLENTRCGFSVREVDGVDLEHTCSIEVTRYAAEDEFPAYDEVICTVDSTTWEGLIQTIESKLEAGDIPKD
jgi:hypothetical protein